MRDPSQVAPPTRRAYNWLTKIALGNRNPAVVRISFVPNGQPYQTYEEIYLRTSRCRAPRSLRAPNRSHNAGRWRQEGEQHYDRESFARR